MRILFFSILLVLFFSCKNNVTDQAVTTANSTIETPKVKLPYPDSLFQIFESKEGEATYVMKQYFMAFLKKGSNRDQSEAEAAQLQEEHLAHINRLADSRHICLVGPSDGTNDIQGFVVYSVPTKAEAIRLTQQDPMVRAGRLVVEVYPWWAAVGGELF